MGVEAPDPRKAARKVLLALVGIFVVGLLLLAVTTLDQPRGRSDDRTTTSAPPD